MVRSCSASVSGMLAVGCLCLLAPTRAQVTPAPTLISFQGRLTNPDGTALPDGSYQLTLSLWDAPTGGAQKWSQTLSNVPVARGLFTVVLNAGTSGLFNANSWLETKVGTDQAMTPRVQMTSVPYALKANTVPDGAIGSVQLASGAVTQEKLATGLHGWLLGGNAGTNPTANFLGTTDLQPIVLKVSGIERVRLGPTGNLGIGATDPQARLQVNSAGVNVAAFIGDLAPFGGALLQTNVGTAGLTHAWFAENGNRVFSLVGGSGYFKNTLGVGGDPFANISTYVKTQPSWNSLYLTDGARTLVTYHGAVGSFDGVWLGTASNHPLIMQTNNAGQFIFTTDGRLGIGTMTPTQALDVNGTAQARVIRITGGSDVAEPFNIHGEGAPEPGMVVAIDPGRTGELRLADTAYNPAVAGIISGANGVSTGMTLSQAGTEADGKHPVALTGRVWCYADAAANGSIAPGDLLTTSTTPGHAMKATDPARRQGAILGKAMSRLDSGKGLVLVLVTLQ